MDLFEFCYLYNFDYSSCTIVYIFKQETWDKSNLFFPAHVIKNY